VRSLTDEWTAVTPAAGIDPKQHTDRLAAAVCRCAAARFAVAFAVLSFRRDVDEQGDP